MHDAALLTHHEPATTRHSLLLSAAVPVSVIMSPLCSPCSVGLFFVCSLDLPLFLALHCHPRLLPATKQIVYPA